MDVNAVDECEDDEGGQVAKTWSMDTKAGVVKLGPGQSFGEEVLLGFVETYHYTTTVTERAKLEMILEDEFNALFNTMPNELERMRRNAKELNPRMLDDLSTEPGLQSVALNLKST